MLLYVEQNGPVKIQHQPSNGILAIKREMGENQSKWQVWIQSKNLNDGIPVSNNEAENLFDEAYFDDSSNLNPIYAIQIHSLSEALFYGFNNL